MIRPPSRRTVRRRRYTINEQLGLHALANLFFSSNFGWAGAQGGRGREYAPSPCSPAAPCVAVPRRAEKFSHGPPKGAALHQGWLRISDIGRIGLRRCRTLLKRLSLSESVGA